MFFDRRLWALTEGARGAIAQCVALGVLASVVGVLRLALLGWLLARILTGAGLAELLWPGLAVALVMFARGALEHWRVMVAHASAARVQTALRARLHAHLLELGPAWFGGNRTGDVLLSLVEGVEQLEVWFGEYLPQLFVAALVPLIIFALLAPFDVVVAGIMLGFALFTLLAPSLFHRWDAASSRRRQRAYAAFAAEFLDSMQGLATLKAFGQSASRGRLLAERAHEVFRTTMWVLATNSLTRGITDTGLALGAATALGVGALRVQSGDMDLTVLLIVLMAGIEVFRPQRDLRSLLHNGMMGLSAAQGIFKVLDAQALVRPATEAARREAPLRPEVAFEAVRFTYPESHRPAHDGLDFRVRPGERVGIVGPSGAGKSSVVKLLLRFHDPQTGRVTLGGVDLRELHPDDLYGAIAVVSQDTVLFHGTVEENIRFGRPEASAEAVRQAALDANAHAFIEALPQGYATVIGERGIRLSGGQRQRIAIARALLRDAPVLVLDEALSAVDAQNEAVIQEALDRLMQGRTTLVFAHRLSSVIGADRILVLEQGRVVESGAHAELIARRGRYHTLMADQLTAGGAPVEAFEARAEDAAAPGVAVELDAGDDGRDILRAAGLGWAGAVRSLFAHARPWRGRLALTFVFGVTRVAALIGVGVIGALVVAAVRAGTPVEPLLWWLALVAPLAGILHWLESWVAHDMAFRMLAEMRVALYHKLDELAPAYLVRRRTGDLVALATHDVEMVEYFFAHTVAPAFVAVLVPGAVLVTLLGQGWPLALALAPFLLLVAASPFLLRRRLDALGSRDRETLGDLNAFVVDTVQGMGEVLAFQQGARREAAFMSRVREHLQARLAFYRDLSLQTAILEAATGLGALAVVGTGAVLVSNGALAASMLPLLTLLALASFLPVSEIAHIGRQLADTLGAARRLHQVHHEPVPVRQPQAPRPLPADAPVALAFEAVTFGYPGTRQPALDAVTFSLPAGQSLALVGPSGAGKSTIAQLALRFWDPDQGTVRLFGVPLREADLEALRARVALVSQETYLFNQSLGENIRMARPGASDAELHRALEQAALGEFVDGLPQGLDTPVGERGVRLSGGQRQRVAIARAFLKDAPLLILDEATSHLDAVNEAIVHRALEALMRDRATLIIAHRLSTVRNADRVLVLDAGRVLEHGRHAELLAAGGLYSRLSARQASVAAQ